MTISLSYVRQSLIREEQKLKGDSKLDGSMDAGAGQALFGKREARKSGGHKHKKVCYLCGEPKHFVGIVRRIVVKRFQSLSTRLSLFLRSGVLGGSHSDTESYNLGGWIIDSGASSQSI